MENFLRIFIDSAQSWFIEVTVFVGAVLLLFGYIDFLQQGAFVETIERLKKYQPIIGALLGIIPGCGGSIFLMPLYLRGTVTFGTVVATLIATSGDSAFVMLTQIPKDFIAVTLICFVTGIIVGYIVDYLKIGDWINRRTHHRKDQSIGKQHKNAELELDIIYSQNNPDCRSCNLKHIGHNEGDAIDLALHHKKPLDAKKIGYKLTHNFYIIFWLLISLGFVLGVIQLTQININTIALLPKTETRCSH